MVQRFRYKFIAISTLALVFVIFTMVGSLSAWAYYRVSQEVQSVLTILVNNNGRIPKGDVQANNVYQQQFSREGLHQYRYFTVYTDTNGHITEIEDGQIATISPQEARLMSNRALKRHHKNGQLMYRGVKYAYRVKNTHGQRMVVFLDESLLLVRSRAIIHSGVILGTIVLVLYALVLTLYSRRAIAPIIQAEQRQKEFITNASHELKTPLTVIAANNEMQEIINGDNEWTASTRQQVARLTKLINNLVSLARMQEQPNVAMMPVNVSDLASQVATSFKSVVQAGDKRFKVAISPDLWVKASEEYLGELFNILLDNANKYCDPAGAVALTVTRASHSKNVVIRVANSYAEGQKLDVKKFFDRFYRVDESHTQGKKAGFGIGLSMAQYIVQMFKGKISAKYHDGKLVIEVILKEVGKID